ncbi:unnamed protein product [Meganyctiphanes norvegica]|uniref:Uncharacterized protein n=1 Tax=Meganyctiphanes norvegica TaxID=48144 RepID=A0AAV2S3X8_MEGNR
MALTKALPHCALALSLILAMLTHGTRGQLGDKRVPLDLPRQEGHVQHRNSSQNNYKQTGLVITDSESNGIDYFEAEYSEDYEDEREVILRPVDATFQGCRDQADDATYSGFINLTQIADLQNLTSKPEACHEYCLKYSPFSMFISLLEPQTNSAPSKSVDFCGCHKDMDLSQLVPCNENYKIYCGPLNVDCRSSATTLQQFTLIVPLILALLLT